MFVYRCYESEPNSYGLMQKFSDDVIDDVPDFDYDADWVAPVVISIKMNYFHPYTEI